MGSVHEQSGSRFGYFTPRKEVCNKHSGFKPSAEENNLLTMPGLKPGCTARGQVTTPATGSEQNPQSLILLAIVALEEGVKRLRRPSELCPEGCSCEAVT